MGESRRAKDQLRRELVAKLKPTLDGLFFRAYSEGEDPDPVRWEALLDFIEFELCDMVAPPFDEAEYTQVPDGVSAEDWARYTETEREMARKSAADAEKFFEFFSRGRMTGALENETRKRAFMAGLKVIGQFGMGAHDWLWGPERRYIGSTPAIEPPVVDVDPEPPKELPAGDGGSPP